MRSLSSLKKEKKNSTKIKKAIKAIITNLSSSVNNEVKSHDSYTTSLFASGTATELSSPINAQFGYSYSPITPLSKKNHPGAKSKKERNCTNGFYVD